MSRQGRPPIIMTGDNRSSRRLDGGYAPDPARASTCWRAIAHSDWPPIYDRGAWRRAAEAARATGAQGVVLP
jgi:hypothetical protein